MKVNIVNYEQGFNNGILSKYARKMHEVLQNREGIEVSISNRPVEGVDINHHINYLPYKPNGTKNTMMVTHIWEGKKLDALKEGMETADFGICFSQDTQDQLVQWGFDKDKLPIILPAHDGIPRRYQVVAILTNVYPDGCKREAMLAELAKVINKNEFAFRIMGSGWEGLLPSLVLDGLQVDYFHDFNLDTHKMILDSSDYLLYFGKDEGAMSVLDAKNAGLKIIAPNVGFHKEIGVDYPFDTQEELNEIFSKLNQNPVKDWTWDKYVDEHIKLWKTPTK